MSTKTVINCMEHSMAQPNQGISIIIDQHTEQQVYNGSTNANIIKIKHSNEEQCVTPTKLITLNNRNSNNNKTLIDIKRNDNQNQDGYEIKEEQQQQHVLQIDCSITSLNEISSNVNELLENSIKTVKLESNNGLLTERGNDRNDVPCNEEHLNLTNGKDAEETQKVKDDVTKNTPLIQQLKSFAVEEDGEESGQTASQQQQRKQRQKADHLVQQVKNNGNSKHRENGQKQSINDPKVKLKLRNDGVKVDDDEEENDNEDNEVTNREENGNNECNNNDDCCISVGSIVQREVIDFSHGERSLCKENSNSLLTKADASTTTSTKTLLTINAPKIPIANNLNLKSNFDNSSDKINHVVKIQIKPNTNTNINTLNNNNNNTFTEKQITVVKIENLQQYQDGNNKISASENIEKETEVKNEKMVQKPSNNTNVPISVSNGNSNVNLNVSNSNGQNAVSGSATTITELNVSNPQYLYYMMSSGQFSPCDTLDSGTGSDLESNGQQTQASPNLQIKKLSCSSNSSSSSSSSSSNNSMAPLEMHLRTTKIRVANNSNSLDVQQRQCSYTDSEESEASSLSCDSLHSNEFLRQSSISPIQSPLKTSVSTNGSKKNKSFLPDSLLREIKNLKFSSTDYEAENEEEDDTLPTLRTDTSITNHLSNEQCYKSHAFMQSRKNLNKLPITMSSSLKRASLPSKTFILNSENGTFIDTKMNSMPRTYEADKYYNFHVHEHDNFRSFGSNGASGGDGDSLSISDYETKSLHDDVFVGYRDLHCGSNTSTIRSSKGTVRGVKNRVRNGIATFLQLQQPSVKNYMEKDLGKVVLYTTSMGIIRDTYAKCSNVKQILRTLLVKFEERDVFMSVEYQQEIKERMHSEVIKVPQLYVEGQHIGDADTVERLNESGELRQLLKPYKSISTTYTCQTCGGYRLLPCPSCNGSKKSVHRNHFTAEFVALKCMNCDEVGLVKCDNC